MVGRRNSHLLKHGPRFANSLKACKLIRAGMPRAQVQFISARRRAAGAILLTHVPLLIECPIEAVTPGITGNSAYEQILKVPNGKRHSRSLCLLLPMVP